MNDHETADRIVGSAQPTPAVQILLEYNAFESIVETSMTAARDSRPSESYTFHCVKEMRRL